MTDDVVVVGGGGAGKWCGWAFSVFVCAYKKKCAGNLHKCRLFQFSLVELFLLIDLCTLHLFFVLFVVEQLEQGNKTAAAISRKFN